MPSSMFSTSQPIDDRSRRRPAQCGQRGEHGGWIHAVCFETSCGGKTFVVGLEDVKGAGRAAIGHRVDEHERVPILEQVIREVHAPDSVVDRMHLIFAAVGHLPDDVSHHLGSETVVSEEDVADAGYQDS